LDRLVDQAARAAARNFAGAITQADYEKVRYLRIDLFSDQSQHERLNIQGEINDLGPIRKLKGLSRLRLSAGQGKYRVSFNVEDFSPLGSLTKLEDLSLNHFKGISDVTPLMGMVRLKRLTIEGSSRLADIKLLANLKNLESLNLNGCGGLTDVSALSGLTKLGSLNLSKIPGLSKSKIDALQQSLPMCKIIHDKAP